MKNQQSYYYVVLLRVLLFIYIYVYTLDGYKHLDILYNNTVSNFTNEFSTLLWVIPNILDHIHGNYVTVVWTLIFFITPFIFFRKCSSIAFLLLVYIFACFYAKNPLTGNVGIHTLIMILCISIFILLPLKKTESKVTGDTYVSPLLFLAIWINFAIYYFYSGYTKLVTYAWQTGQTLIYIDTHPSMRGGFILELYRAIPTFIKKILTYFVAVGELIAPLFFLNKSIMKAIWFGILVIQLGLLIFMNLPDIQSIMLIYSLMTFDPAWISGVKSREKLVVYYDGYCALCHGFVEHVINIDNDNIVYFKLIQNSKFAEENKDLKTIVVSAGEKTLTKTDAVIFIYRSCGGLFRIYAFFMNLCPRFIADKVYDFVAKNRYRMFGKKVNTCPIMREELLYKFI